VAVFRTYPLLLEDESNPALRLHKLQGKRGNELAIDIESNLRITFVKISDNIVLIDLITHDEY